MSQSDWQLMRKVAEGDQKSFNAVYEQHRRRVWGICKRIMGDGKGAEDMAQETWIKIVKSASSYRPVAGLGAWICQIARNTCLNGLRDMRWEEPIGEADAVAPDNLEEVFSEASKNARFEQAFAGLADQQRVVLTMFVFEELSHAEIAGQLNISVGSVKQLIYRAKERLRTQLKEWA